MEDKLIFPKEQYTLKTEDLQGPGISCEIVYKEYRMIPYCANPVDLDFQSMDVYVPVKVDGQEVDTTDAPIFLSNHIQAYTSWNIRTNTPGMPHPGMPRRPGPGGPGGPSGRGGPGGPNDGTRPGKYGKPFLPLYAMARGLVVVKPGARGRDNQAADGTYYGKAPAAIVDLKAAIRYIRHNKGSFPGNTDKIFSNGGSAGGAISAALGASGNCDLFNPYLKAIGAAEESDAVMGTICHCPIMDLDHADAAYEWMFGPYPVKDKLVDQEKSCYLAGLYAEYLKELNLQGRNGFGTLTAENLGNYIVKEYMVASAEHYLKEEVSPQERDAYLKAQPWISWDGQHASFSFPDLVKHIGRMKELGSFDGRGEMSLFGNETVDGRHFTEFGVKQDDPNGVVEPEVQHLVKMMNPMYYVRNDHPGCSRHWYLCVGSKDPHTAHAVSTVFATLLENKGMDTSLTYLWDYGHNCEDDPVEMVDWIINVAAKG